MDLIPLQLLGSSLKLLWQLGSLYSYIDDKIYNLEGYCGIILCSWEHDNIATVNCDCYYLDIYQPMYAEKRKRAVEEPLLYKKKSFTIK